MTAPQDQDASASLQRMRLWGLCVLAFLLMFSYALARPATESLFIRAHTSKGLPLAWICVSLGMIVVVLGYNKVVSRVRLMRLFWLATGVSLVLLLVLLLARAATLPGVYYLLYVWKDIYMVVLMEVYYSFTNSVFSIKKARWYYGLFGTVGAIGGISGNMLMKYGARGVGTDLALWMVVPVLAVILLTSRAFDRLAGVEPQVQREAAPRQVAQYLRAAWRSPYLLLILLLIALVQGVVTLADFEFNKIVELAYPDTDLRTGVISTVYASVSAGTVLFHAITGPVLRLAGVPATLLAIPLLLGTGFGAFWLMPIFLTVAVVKVCSKCFDYTLFRNAKEILYIPLSYQERTQGKALVDMLTYRIAKGGTSLMLLGLIAVGGVLLVKHLTALLLVLWLVTTVVVARRFRQKVSREEELG